MKCISVLPLLAITISPSLSQPHHAATDTTPGPALRSPRSSQVPKACHDTIGIVDDQLNEISRLQSKSLPTTHDLAGYLYAVNSGRKMLGCPNDPLISANDNTTSASQQFKRSSGTGDPLGHNPTWNDPCDVVRFLKNQVDDQMRVMGGYNIPTPDYLAGWFSGTQDLDEGLECGMIHHHAKGSGHRNATISKEE